MLLKPILEVIEREHECASTFAVAQAIALGYAYESKGKLYLTRAGKLVSL